MNGRLIGFKVDLSVYLSVCLSVCRLACLGVLKASISLLLLGDLLRMALTRY